MGFVTCTTEGAVALVRLHRPERQNALDRAMRRELLDAVVSADADSSVRAIVLTGEGGAFSAGEDLKAFAEGEETAGLVLREGYHRLLRALLGAQKPTVALVDGIAAGAGLSLALACDLRLATERARFLLAFSGVGLVPDAGLAYLLPRMVGLSRALLLALRNEPLTAEEARSQGLVAKVLPPEGALEAAVREAGRLAAGPTLAFSLTRKAMLAAFDLPFEAYLEVEASLQERATASADYREGVAAFLAKRRPEFRGR